MRGWCITDLQCKYAWKLEINLYIFGITERSFDKKNLFYSTFVTSLHEWKANDYKAMECQA